MEGGVEYGNLGYVGENLLYGIDTFEVGRVVQRSNVDALDDFLFYGLVDEYRLVELLAAVYDAVAYGIDLFERGDAAVFFAHQRIEYEFDADGVFGNIFFENDLLAAGQGEFEERAFQADFLDAALCQHGFGVGLEEFVFNR